MKSIFLLINCILILTLKTHSFFLPTIDVYSDICYDDLGCFTNRPPFSTSLARPVALLPESPEKVAPRFILYTRANPTSGSLISHDQVNSMFKATSETKILIHGFLDNGFNKHNTDVKDALLRVGDYNVIVVDWSKGNGFPYTQATANTQIVGAMIARLVNSLIERYSISPARFHIIGHSLGAHTAGYAGERIPNLGRITGLDPAGPYFENTHIKVRLDESDANFVEAIHTDGSASIQLGLGLLQKSGHVDFYLNGGKDQPSCPATSGKILTGIFNLATVNVDGFLEDTICSHLSAVWFFRDSIENLECQYQAYPCSSQNDFNSGKCLQCGPNGCNKMGFYASSRTDNGSLYLNTQDAKAFPYCQHHFVVSLTSNTLAGQNQARGLFKITLIGDRTNSLPLELDNADVTFKPGSIEKRLIASAKYVGENINQITVSYTKTSNIITSLLYQDQWSFRQIEILYGDNQQTLRFCPTANYIQSGSSVTFNKC